MPENLSLPSSKFVFEALTYKGNNVFFENEFYKLKNLYSTTHY